MTRGVARGGQRTVAVMLALAGMTVVPLAAATSQSSPDVASTPPVALSRTTSGTPSAAPTDAGSGVEQGLFTDGTRRTLARATEPVPAGPAANPASVAPPSSVAVPSVAIDSDLVELELASNGSLQAPQDFERAGWYVGAPRPGTIGPAIIAGHVDSTSGPAVFSRLREVEPGDRIHVGRTDGTEATFVATRIERHPKARFPTDAVYGDVGHAAPTHHVWRHI